MHHTTEFYKVFIKNYIPKTETEIDINVKKQKKLFKEVCAHQITCNITTDLTVQET